MLQVRSSRGNEEDNRSMDVSMIDCGIKSLKDVPLQLNTISINLHSNQIQRIENLHFLQSLVNLDLSSNHIKKIDGIQGLVSLENLNLSCNFIISIENLDGLKKLRSLNLSYNKIQYINGLSDLWGTDYAIDTILLNGNFLSSIEEITYYLSGLVRLKNITLNNNKFLANSDYRLAVFGASKSLVSIDGKDKTNRSVKYTNTNAKLNQFTEFIDLNKSIEDGLKFNVNYPKLDQSKRLASNKQAQNQPGNFRNKSFGKNDSINASNNKSIGNDTTYVSKEINKMFLKTSDLDVIEEKIHKLLSLRNRYKTKNREYNSSLSTSSESEEMTNRLDLSSSSTPILVKSPKLAKRAIKESKSHDNLADKHTGPIKSILKPSNVTITIGDRDASASPLSINNKPIDKSSKTDLIENTLSNSQTSFSFENKNDKKEFIGLMQTQLDTYKKSTELNIQLISDLREKLESVTNEKQSIIAKKEALNTSLTASNALLNTQLSESKLKIESLECKVKTYEDMQLSKPNETDKIEIMKSKLKKTFQIELEKMKKSNEAQCSEHQSAIAKSEAAIKSLENEFRSALIIESNRYNDLFTKYEQANKELNTIKTNYSQIEQSDNRNKSLIKELNELIKEQKTRLNALSKVRKEASNDIQARSEKLNEAVSDCVKLKSQLEELKKEKVKCEAQLKMIAIKYKEIEQEKMTWTQKLNDQKCLTMQEMSRLNVENQTSATEIEILKKNLAKEADDVKIKAKIIEDQTETIKKLKQGLFERDAQLKDHRDEALRIQKSLEKQLNEEMDQTNELQVKFDKVNLRKEELKAECEELKSSLDETKLAYEELTNKWKQKSDLITDLDCKVRKMKENYENKEQALMEETNALREETNTLNERLRKIDDNFRAQYDVEKREHLKLIEKTRNEYEVKLKKSDAKVKEIEEEMRQILYETAEKKKFYENKIKSFSNAFQNIRADFEID